MPAARPSAPARRSGRPAASGALVLIAFVALLLPSTAGAQGQAASKSKITNKALIGDAVSQADSSRYADVADAIRRFTNRDLPGAQLLLEKAKRKSPKLPPVSVMLARMYQLSGNLAAVRPALEQSIVEDADDPEPYLILAEDLLNSNRTIEADALFDKAVTLIQAFDDNPKRKRTFVIRAYKGRAVVNQRRRKWEAAESDLRAWLETDPENAKAHNQLGSVLFQLDRKKDGLAEFAEAKRLDDNLPNPYITGGAVLLRSGAAAEAVQYFERAYRDDNKADISVTQYANSLIVSGDLKAAARVLKDGRRDVPESFNVKLLSGVAARMLGDNAAAERYFLDALALQPVNRDVLLQLSYTLSESKDADSLRRARQFAALNVRLGDKNPDAQVAYAWAIEQAGQPREAEAALRNALQLGSPGSDGTLLVAKMLIARGNKDSAKQLLSGAIAKRQGIFVGRAEAEKLLAELN